MANNNRELFISGYLDTISQQFPKYSDSVKNRNHAFEILSIAVILNKPFSEVADKIQIKGTNDGGFDGIFFEDQGGYYAMHVFQCKNADTLKQNELDKFRNDFKDIFLDNNKVGRTNIFDVQPWIDEYRQLTVDKYVIEPSLHFIFNGSKDDEVNSMNKSLFELFHKPKEHFCILDADDIYKKISNFLKQKREEISFIFKPERSNIALRDNQALYTYGLTNIKSAHFRIPALAICELIENEIKVNGSYDFLFEENIRSFLGYRAKANQRMRETLNDSQAAVYFPFLNNGITIICDELTVPSATQAGDYLVPVKNPQIVNGLQTSLVLYQANRETLKDVYINIRIYETREKYHIEKITDATNTQSPINYRDKVSNKEFSDYAKTIFNNANVQFITKRGESFFPKVQQSGKETVDSDTVIKFWYATFFEKPEIAKNSISNVLQEIYEAATSEKHQLRELFKGDKDSPVYKQMLSAYRMYRIVQLQKQKNVLKYDFINHADELLCYGIYKDLGSNLVDYEDEIKMAAAYKKSIRNIDKIIKNERKRYEAKGSMLSYSSFFKKPACRNSYNTKLGLFETDNIVETLLQIR